MIYGHNKTIHGTEFLDVETDKDGKVVSVWFRCMALPFKQTYVDMQRSKDMKRAYAENKIPNILAVEVSD